MPFLRAAIALLAFIVLAGCNPTFNWREARFTPSGLVALLPCKPDKAERTVKLGGLDVPLQMQGCDAGGATFAVAVAQAPDATQAAAVMAHWKASTLANMRATGSRDITPDKSALARVPRVAASGTRADGRPVTAQALWLASGARVFHAVVYADKIDAGVADTFFSGLKLP